MPFSPLTTSIERSRATTPPEDATVPASNPGADLNLGSDFGGCFGCGADHPGGLRMERTAYDGTVVHGEFFLTDAHQGAPGLAHGGILATAMDEIIGTASWLLGKMSVTGRLETDFLAPVPVGTTVHVRAWCTGVAGRKIYLEGEGRLGASDGPVAVRAAALFIEVAREHFNAG